MIINKLVNVSQKLVLANDHDASSSNLKDQDKEKYFQPKWCPPGLTHIQKKEVAASSPPRTEGKRGGEVEG